MGRLAEQRLPNGDYYAELVGFGGETDFYRIYDVMNELLCPEKSRTNVDSLCVMATFVKDGITVRMSSEGIDENVAFQCAASYGEEAFAKVRSWIEQLDKALL